MSAGGCLCTGMSLRQYIIVRCFLYNKILKAETMAAVVFSRLGFPSKILVFMCDAIGSSLKIDEMWSVVLLRVVAFSQGVVAPFQERLVNKNRGS